MKIAIVVDSKTGNTRMVAKALASALDAAVTPLAEGASEAVASADTVLAGFWCDKGDCSPEMAEFLGTLSGKRVFLFGTAGFGGSQPYFERVLANVAKHLPADAELIGQAMCQGRIAAGFRARYEAALQSDPTDERARVMIHTFDVALNHPSQQDFGRITTAAKKALGL